MGENKIGKFQLLFETETITTPFVFSNPEVNIWHFCHACVNPLNAKLNPFCHLLALLGAHHILHVSRIRVNVGHGSVFRRAVQLQLLDKSVHQYMCVLKMD
jgi:hypothetical protein